MCNMQSYVMGAHNSDGMDGVYEYLEVQHIQIRSYK